MRSEATRERACRYKLLSNATNAIARRSSVSYARWSTNYFWRHQAKMYDPFLFPSVDAKTTEQGYFSSTVECGLVLFAIGVVFRVVAFLQIRAIKRSNAGGGGAMFFWE